MATSLDQLQQLDALFHPLGQSIANYGEMQFQLAQHQKEQARQEAMAALAAQKEYDLRTTIQGMSDIAAKDRAVAQIDAMAGLEQQRETAAQNKALDAQRYAAFLAYAQATGTKKLSDFSPGVNGLAEIQQETKQLQDQEEQKALGSIYQKGVGLQGQIDKLSGVTDADMRQAVRTAAEGIKTSINPFSSKPGSSVKDQAEKLYMADRAGFLDKLGPAAPGFLTAMDAELARIKQQKETLNADDLRTLRLGQQNLITTQGAILAKHPDWADKLVGGSIAAPGAPGTPPPAANPFGAYVNSRFPKIGTATSATPSVQVPFALSPDAARAAGVVVPATPETPPPNSLFSDYQNALAQQAVDQNQGQTQALARTKALQDAIRLRVSGGQPLPDAFSAALAQQQQADALRKMALNSILGVKAYSDFGDQVAQGGRQIILPLIQQQNDEAARRRAALLSFVTPAY